jgi:hypothetical protein
VSLPDDIGIFQAYFINIAEKIRGIIEDANQLELGTKFHWPARTLCHRISGHFNPSIVEDFDQSNLRRRETRDYFFPCHRKAISHQSF